MRDTKLDAAVDQALSKGPIRQSTDLSKMSTEYLKQLVDDFEGKAAKELINSDSKIAYNQAKAELKKRQNK